MSLLGGVLVPPVLCAKTPADPARIFAPLVLPDAPNAYRSGSGLPGPQYWQNRTDYTIHSRIDTQTHVLHGSETVAYTNNSPDQLDILWLQLDQNIYRPDARAVYGDRYDSHHTDGLTVERVSIVQGGHETEITPLISDTRMQLRLPRLIEAHGMAYVKVDWHYTLPGPWGGRTAVTPNRAGDIYEIAQWYPRLSVYDDRRGWNTLPYLGQEFFLEYGNFDYSVTVPWNYTLVGSGALLNPEQTLTPTERSRLAQAAQSDTRVMIRTLDDVTDPKSHLKQSGEATWHYGMHNSRDVAFAASPSFLWDAARIRLQPVVPWANYHPVPRLAMSIYPREGIGPHGWDRSTEYVKHAIEYFSSQWYEYPWPNAVNLAGHGAGMEYPGIVFDGISDRDPELFWITTHELGHSWFPMIVGTDERRNAFMDEGFNTFIDAYASDHFKNGEFAPKRDSEFAPETGNPAQDIVPVLTDPQAPTLMTPADAISEHYRHSVSYFKGAYGLKLLREQILGPVRFDAAFRRYIASWAFRHPSPSDFFRMMESEGGEDLGWFWRGWYFTNAAPDYALGHIRRDAGKPAEVQVLNYGTLPLPVVLHAEYADGHSEDVRIPTEAWRQKSDIQVTLSAHSGLKAVTLDPNHVIPDIDRADNRAVLAP
ncbi:peptidase [Gluconobacter morbifer G707]|uniref:Peptidase n=1 Tax=Gluconobacter morbifer G707 TaxID=1088869 RepID=G6XJT3_9PROT|nr:peptidase [Gluconobacter morbifer G707]